MANFLSPSITTDLHLPKVEFLQHDVFQPLKPHSVNHKPPVILVHGFMYTGRRMHPLARYLRSCGWEAYTVDILPSWGQVGIDRLAQRFASFLDRRFAPHTPVNLVGFSMGGLTCRYYVQRMGGLARTERLITIATPHHGTVMANCMNRPACVQMRRGSEFLKELNRDIEALEQVKFASIWTPLDLMILPATSSRLGVGRERKLWIGAHPLMVLQPSALKAVAELLEE
jgi:triacylglycerol lipase